RCALRPPQLRESRCRVRASWPVFQHFTKQVVVRSQRAENPTKPNGWDIQDAMRNQRLTRGSSIRSHYGDFFSFGEMSAVFQDHDAMLDSATNNHEPPHRIGPSNLIAPWLK